MPSHRWTISVHYERQPNERRHGEKHGTRSKAGRRHSSGAIAGPLPGTDRDEGDLSELTREEAFARRMVLARIRNCGGSGTYSVPVHKRKGRASLVLQVGVILPSPL